MEIDIVEVTKLPKEGDGTPLWLWGRFFKAETEEEFDMLAKKDADVEKAVTIIRRLSGSERERRLADMEELARMDEVAGRRVAYNEGIAKGKAEGIAEGKAEGIAEGKAELEKAKNEFAKSLLGSNVPVDTISKATGLSRKDIERLR
jgi:predicted transposase/invertase (TIGR01784 family)